VGSSLHLSRAVGATEGVIGAQVRDTIPSMKRRPLMIALIAGISIVPATSVPAAHGPSARAKVFRVQLDADKPREQVRIEPRRCEQPYPCSRVVVRDGQRRVALTKLTQPKDGYGWDVARVRVRDLTGDGRREIIWELDTAGATVSSPTLVGVDQWDGRRASRIFTFTNVGAMAEPGYSDVVTAQVKIVAGTTALPEIETTESLHGRDDPNCCPSARRKRRHRWDGRHISPLPETKRIEDEPTT